MSPDALRARVGELRARIATRRRELQEAYRGNAPGALLREWSAVVDATLLDLWRETDMPRGWALAAVGGYGRRELFPCSDVDLLILLDAPVGPDEQPLLDRLVGTLWDIGLEVGHSVRTAHECLEAARNDITVATNLIEARWLTGDRALFRRFGQARDRALDVRLFVHAKRVEQEQRHARQQNAASSLEPNIKEAPGGLRDLHVVLWMARACGFGADWAALQRSGLIDRGEAAQIRRDYRFLQDLRIRLHRLTRRREDRLLFDWQTALAGEMGLADQRGRRASERLMQRYYRTAKSVMLLNTLLLRLLDARLHAGTTTIEQVLDEDFAVRDGLLDIRDTGVFEQQPPAILRAFLELARRPEVRGFSATALREIWRARRRVDAGFRRDPRNVATFNALLRQPRGLTRSLQRMNRCDILGRYLPEFGRIVGQMQHDLFHVYTVDEHILMVLRNVRRFAQAEFAHEYPLCSRLMAEFKRPEVLWVAALYHDIAKGRGGDHSTLGALDVRRFCRRHGFGKEDTRLAEFLVEHHLLMSATAQKQDLSDPAVIRAFCAKVPGERALTALYLLTVADIRGTSPSVWNAWKGKLLEDLYRQSLRHLRGDRGAQGTWVQARQGEAERILRLYGLSAEPSRGFWATLEPDYFMRNTPGDIAWHARSLFGHHATIEPLVRARLAPIGEGLQVLVYSPEREDLFARVTGAFERMAYSIVEARLHTTRGGYNLFTFLVMDPGRTPARYRDVVSLVEHDLLAALTSDEPLPPPLQGRISRQVRHFPISPEINLRSGENPRYRILTIITADQPGLLSRTAQVLLRHAVAVHSAKVNTLRERAEDTFLVSGPGLSDAQQVAQLEQDLAGAIAVR
ncbi:MAG: [protein-PII] uridylyltransferase [Rhodocyclaceae bacterium]|nr:[protein-PII] uridylyltransferase [Rhodocyclaceae bacterium]